MWAPKGTPPQVVKKLTPRSCGSRAARSAEIRGLGGIPVGNTPAEFDAYQRAELEKWSRIVKESGAKVD